MLAPKYQHVGIPNANTGIGGIAQRQPPTPALQWNIGLRGERSQEILTMAFQLIPNTEGEVRTYGQAEYFGSKPSHAFLGSEINLLP